MHEFVDIDALAAFLRATRHTRIGVDGANGAGKTTLARELSGRLGYPVVSLDDLITGNTGFVAEDVDYSMLGRATQGEGGCIVEGVCLLEVLERLGVAIPALVYVKRRRGGAWADEPACELGGDVDAFLERAHVPLGFREAEGIQRATLGVGEEVVRYHAAHRPQRRADAVFWRDED